MATLIEKAKILSFVESSKRLGSLTLISRKETQYIYMSFYRLCFSFMCT